MAVAYLYGQEAFGLFSIFVVTNAVAQSLLTAAFVNPFVREFQRANASSEVYVRLALLFALVLFFIAQFLFYCVFTDFNISLILSFSGCFTQIRNYYKSLNISRMNIFWSYFPDLVFSLLCLLSVPLVLLFKFSFFIDFIYLYLVSSIVSLFTCFYNDRFYLGMSKVGLLRFLVIAKERCGHSFVSSFFMEVINNGYNFAIVFFYGTLVYSNYSLAFMFLRPLTLVTMTLNQIYRAHLSRDSSKHTYLFKRFLMVNTSALILNIFFVSILAYFFLNEISDSYDRGLVINVFLIMILVSFFRYLKSWCIIRAQSLGQFTQINKIAIPNSVFCALSLTLVGLLNLNSFFMTIVLMIFEVLFLLGFRKKG
ncbi:hypothetical protein WH43_10945 [Rheinheimera sp. KL1]|nr:hypothetical protein WH43_10945 [Rheinheimera sp. KL1]